jgi:prepilin-type N-terminal cleavage/methylation domain-containing protein
MTLATGRFLPRKNLKGFCGAKTPGFTLVEILAVLAIMALLSALLLSGGDNLLKAAARDDVENIALSAIANARHSAVLTGRELDLRYIDTTRQLDWEEGQATLTGDDTVRLLPPARTGAVLIGGRLFEEPLARVHFYPDGTCDPFRLEIIRHDSSRILPIDPWTCAVLSSTASTP